MLVGNIPLDSWSAVGTSPLLSGSRMSCTSGKKEGNVSCQSVCVSAEYFSLRKEYLITDIHVFLLGIVGDLAADL